DRQADSHGRRVRARRRPQGGLRQERLPRPRAQRLLNRRFTTETRSTRRIAPREERVIDTYKVCCSTAYLFVLSVLYVFLCWIFKPPKSSAGSSFLKRIVGSLRACPAGSCSAARPHASASIPSLSISSVFLAENGRNGAMSVASARTV